MCSPGNIVAGPFHPAFGEIVKSMAVRNELTPQIMALVNAGRSKIKIYVPQNMESKLRGQRNSNIKCWQKMGAGIEIIKTKNASIYLEGENNE